MSNYYDYREVKVMIAQRLMAMDGWKIYDYRADESDSMTDYWSPAHWDGIATKNGYTLCVDVYGKSEPKEIREYNYNNNTTSNINVMEKIQKLEAVTMQRGATEHEETTAKEKIVLLTEKSEVEATERNKYIVTGYIPGHMEHPPKCNWHVEKDGMIILKGNGILKYSDLWNYSSERDKDTLESIRDDEKLERASQGGYNDTLEKRKLFKNFNEFINKIDTVCGGLIGEGDGTIYEKVITTEYKKENKIVECDGSIKEGQCFVLKSSFMHGKRKGLAYKIHEVEYENGEKRYYAYKLNRKLTKECTGSADTSNEWHAVGSASFNKWIESGNIAFCRIETEKVPYEVEKVIKKTISNGSNNSENVEAGTQNEKENTSQSLNYDIKKDIHTKNASTIYVVKIVEKLDRDKYIEVNNYMESLGGYYSKFKHGFIFKEDPTELLVEQVKNANANQKEEKKEQKEKANDNQKLIGKINTQIVSFQKKINSLSGDYKTNTYKRMGEQEGRQSKIDSMEIDIKILEHIWNKLSDNTATELDKALIIGTFREVIHRYYILKYGKYPTEIEFPQISATAAQWYNDEVPKRQARLKKAGINNSTELEQAVEEYKIVYDECRKSDPVTEQQRKIKKLEAEYKLQQKADINFTPSDVASQMVDLAQIDEQSIVLESSAGIGNIADEIKKVTNNIDCCERMTRFQELLRLKGYNVVGDDFLQYQKYNYYDAIIMNPPFSKNQDIEHLKHAFTLLKDGGTLVCITSPHWTFAKDKTSLDFRNWIQDITYDTIDLERGTFEMTDVTSKIIIIQKEGQTQQRTS